RQSKSIIFHLAIHRAPILLIFRTAEEKALFDALKSFPSTVFSPHVAGWTTESYAKINQVLLEKIKAHFTR
ncbi:MAG: hypothetical protein ACKOXH_09185, partial [Aquirufa sp.]